MVGGVVGKKVHFAVVPHWRGVRPAECGQAGCRLTITDPEVGGHSAPVALPTAVISRPRGVNKLARGVDVCPRAVRDRKLLQWPAFLIDREQLGAFGVSLDAAGKKQNLACRSPATQRFPCRMIRQAGGYASVGWHGPEIGSVPKISLKREHLAIRRKSRTVGAPNCLHQWGCCAPSSWCRPNSPRMGEGDLGFGEIGPSQQTSVGRVLTKGKGRQQKRDAHAINVNGQLGISCP